MPELPEVETTRRGIEPHIYKQTVTDVVVRNNNLRWPVPSNLPQLMQGQCVTGVHRRGKYLLLSMGLDNTVIIHLGMSGSIRVVDALTLVNKHDHVDICFSNGKILRYTDPRRFGCMLWHEGDLSEHKLLAKLGPEPLSDQFDGEYLFAFSRRRKTPVKTFVMNSAVVVGVGNIYANEALFFAGIHPNRETGRISRHRYYLLVEEIKKVLEKAIKQGGTTLKDFVGSDGKPGYFKQQLHVYGRGGEPCVGCGGRLTEIRLAQRSTVFCKRCQS